MAGSSCTDVRAVITDSYLHKDAAGVTWRGRRRRVPASFQRGGEHVAERTEQDSY